MDPIRQLLACLSFLLVTGLSAQVPGGSPEAENGAVPSYGFPGDLHWNSPETLPGSPGSGEGVDHLSRTAGMTGNPECVRGIYPAADMAGHFPGFSRMQNMEDVEPCLYFGTAFLSGTGGNAGAVHFPEDKGEMSVLLYTPPETRMADLRIEQTRNEVVKKLKMDQWDFSGLLREMVSPPFPK